VVYRYWNWHGKSAFQHKIVFFMEWMSFWGTFINNPDIWDLKCSFGMKKSLNIKTIFWNLKRTDIICNLNKFTSSDQKLKKLKLLWFSLLWSTLFVFNALKNKFQRSQRQNYHIWLSGKYLNLNFSTYFWFLRLNNFCSCICTLLSKNRILLKFPKIRFILKIGPENFNLKLWTLV